MISRLRKRSQAIISPWLIAGKGDFIEDIKCTDSVGAEHLSSWASDSQAAGDYCSGGCLPTSHSQGKPGAQVPLYPVVCAGRLAGVCCLGFYRFFKYANINNPSRLLHQKEKKIFLLKMLLPSFSILIRTRRKQKLSLFLEESTGAWRNLFLFLALARGLPGRPGPRTARNSSQRGPGRALYLECSSSWCWKASQMWPAGDITSQIATVPLHLEDKSAFRRNLSMQVHCNLN